MSSDILSTGDLILMVNILPLCELSNTHTTRIKHMQEMLVVKCIIDYKYSL